MTIAALSLAVALAFPRRSSDRPHELGRHRQDRRRRGPREVPDGFVGLDQSQATAEPRDPLVLRTRNLQLRHGADAGGLGHGLRVHLRAGKIWNKGEVITICNGWTCIDFKHAGAGFEAVASYADPNVGYTNRPRSDSVSYTHLTLPTILLV